MTVAVAPVGVMVITVVVVEEDETDGDDADDEAEKDEEALGEGDVGILAEELGGGLCGGEVDVDTATEGEEEALGPGSGFRHHERDGAEEDPQARDEVDGQGPEDLKPRDVDQKGKVGKFLGELVVHRRRGDRPAPRCATFKERLGDHDPVHEVAEKIACGLEINGVLPFHSTGEINNYRRKFHSFEKKFHGKKNSKIRKSENQKN